MRKQLGLVLLSAALSISGCDGAKSGPPMPAVGSCGKSICVDASTTLLDRNHTLFAPTELMMITHRSSIGPTDYGITIKELSAPPTTFNNGDLEIQLNGTPTPGKTYALSRNGSYPDDYAIGALENGGSIMVVFTYDGGPKPTGSGAISFQQFGSADGSVIAASIHIAYADGEILTLGFAGNIYGPGAHVPCTAANGNALCPLYLPASVCSGPTTISYFTGGQCAGDGYCQWTTQSYGCPNNETCTNGGCPVHSTVSR